jgi:hypothetical protein
MVTDDSGAVRPDDSRRQEVKVVGLVADDDRVPGVVAALHGIDAIN